MTNEYINEETGSLINNLGFIFCPSQDYKREACTVEKSQYDEVYNNYKAKISQTLTFKMPENKILDYVITVPFDWKSNKAPYLRGLTTQGTINLDLLNSGNSNLKGYRFLINDYNKSIKIALFFELYPKPNTNFKDLELEFIDINGKKIVTYQRPGTINNGSTVIDINNWTQYGLQEQEFYYVVLRYTDCDNKPADPVNLWLLTTELFNSCYNPGSPDFISNYCYPVGNESSIIKEKCTIKVEIVNTNIGLSNTVSYSTKGSLISTDRDNIDFTSIQTNSISINSSGLRLQVKNAHLYPKHIIFHEDRGLINAKLNVSDLNSLFDEAYHNLNNPFGKMSDYLYAENTDTGINIISKERIKGMGQQGNFTNVFVKMSDALPQILEQTTQFCGLFPDIDNDADHDGGDVDGHCIFLEKSTTEDGGISFSQPLEDDYDENAHIGYIKTEGNTKGYLVQYDVSTLNYAINTTVKKEDCDPEYHRYYNKICHAHMSDINAAFNEFTTNSELCTWIFSRDDQIDDDGNNWYQFWTGKQSGTFSTNSQTRFKFGSASRYTIIWWKSKKENLDTPYWRASKVLIPKEYFSDYKKLTEALFGQDFYFCFIQDQGNGELNLYIPDENTSTKFMFTNDITLYIPVEISATLPTNAFDGLEKVEKLKFTAVLESKENQNEYKEIVISHSDYGLEDRLTGVREQQNLLDTQGRKKDSNEDDLTIGSIYVENNGNLRKVENNPFIVDLSSTFASSKGFSCRNIYCNEDKGIDDKIVAPSGRWTKLPQCIVYDNGLELQYTSVPLIPQVV